MRPPTLLPRKIGIFVHPGMPEAASEADAIARFLEEQRIQTFVCTSRSDDCMRRAVDAGEIDVMIALGGDGTMLRAGHLSAPSEIPVLGINMGHFGFLMEVQQAEWRQVLPRLLEGDFRLEDRMLLQAAHLRNGNRLAEWLVVNEVVVCRGQFVRPVRLRASVDGYVLASYVADGLIAATATGSTAYALAAGGPIMPPELRNILIIPVAPHLSVDRAVILSEGASVTIRVFTSHEAVLSADGHPPVSLRDGDDINVAASEHSLAFVRFQDPGYFYRNLTLYMEQNPSATGAA